MSLIINKPAGIRFDPETVAICRKKNPGAFGFMFADRGKIEQAKGEFDTDHVQKIFTDTIEFDTTYFFRDSYYYNETKTEENFAPMQLLNKEECGRDVWVIHSGYFYAAKKKDESKSDSYNLVYNFLRPFFLGHIWALDDPNFHSILRMAVGDQNKIVFLDNDGNKNIINKAKGFDFGDCWLSNDHSHKLYSYEHGYNGQTSLSGVAQENANYQGMEGIYGF